MIKIPAITYYVSEIEKKQFKKYADARGISNAKLTSLIIRAWVQAQMGDQGDEYEEF